MHIDTLKTLAIDALEELKARDITQLDVSALTQVTDLMLIASGTSTRHVSALAQNVVEKAKAAGLKPQGVEGGDNADWVLVDLGDVLVHVMLPEARALYDLERLWADLPSDGDGEGAIRETLQKPDQRITMS
ncbi:MULTISPECIES: ribosome silencing factor [unclassified Halomonas]|uniref:ribosome silencing factor n=1 Tax=unclassified Halomonas TaxID=2609666 RepID=UPI00209EED22|nr:MULTISPECIES: ribosome silencing factor [unclassified Halomonas]MCP1314477.1 ribosome silencing factor [Halomonas sp. 707D7]MCP1328268.1 ribosome silencing factor [Halomonas sp. 707D4]